MVLVAALLIVIDPGHTTANPGAIAVEGAVEATRNLEVARVLGTTLKSRGAKVTHTRTKDEELSLIDRAKKAAGSDLLLSIHHDAPHGEAPDIRGFSLHVRADSKESVRIATHITDASIAIGDFKKTVWGRYEANDSAGRFVMFWGKEPIQWGLPLVIGVFAR